MNTLSPLNVIQAWDITSEARPQRCDQVQSGLNRKSVWGWFGVKCIELAGIEGGVTVVHALTG